MNDEATILLQFNHNSITTGQYRIQYLCCINRCQSFWLAWPT